MTRRVFILGSSTSDILCHQPTCVFQTNILNIARKVKLQESKNFFKTLKSQKRTSFTNFRAITQLGYISDFPAGDVFWDSGADFRTSLIMFLEQMFKI